MTLDEFLSRTPDCMMAEIVATKGSTPRETGAFMLVSENVIFGTIGGGNLELEAIQHARTLLKDSANPGRIEVVLGPETGQCCGGRVTVGFKLVDLRLAQELKDSHAARIKDQPQVVLYGAGHVGRALANALLDLPFRLSVVETRADELRLLSPRIPSRLTAIPEQTIAAIAPGGAVVILTHDHALDFLIAMEALKRKDLAYVGMIGSETKRGVLANWLRRHDQPDDLIERLVLPIGGRTVKDKRPEVIAALVAAELVETLLGD